MTTFSNNSRKGSEILFLGLLLVSLALPAAGLTIPGDDGDARIRENPTNSTYDVYTGMDIIGAGHYTNTLAGGAQGSTAVFFFELPASNDVGVVHNAVFTFSLTNRSGSFSTNPANVDVYGLGFVTNTTIDTGNAGWYYYAGTNDTRTGAGIPNVVKVAEDIMTPDTFDPQTDVPPMTSPPIRLVAADPELADFLNLCYANGAAAGDYAVVRMSIDEETSLGTRRYDVCSANHTNADYRPVLSLNESLTVLFDPFEDGSRTNGTDLLDTSWYILAGQAPLGPPLNLPGTELNVTNVPGFGTGDSLDVNMLGTKDRFMGAFPAVTLDEPGDFLQVTLEFRPYDMQGAVGTVNGFRFGLYEGGPPTADIYGSGLSAFFYPGHMFRLPSLTGVNYFNLTQSFDDGEDEFTPPWYDDSSLLGGEGYTLSTDDSPAAPVLVPDTVYSLLWNVTLTSATTTHSRVVLNGKVLVGRDPDTSADNDNPPPEKLWWEPINTVFNNFAFGCNAGNVDFNMDNVLVQTRGPAVIPHTQVLADAVEMRFETEPTVTYSLDEATSLVSSNWAGTGYAVMGDGGELRTYDPGAVEGSKSYRLGDGP